jgi:NAD(P)-dependent dehydrogenase (short-subunit alcohol dehydrogenase family)
VSAGRTYVVTGSASGIGAATSGRLRAAGARVVGVDVRDAEVIADLSTAAGRRVMLEGVEDASGGSIDAVIACAGIGSGAGDTDAAVIVRVNFFGAVATLDGLRPLLAAGNNPRAAVTGSIAALFAHNDALVDACLAGDERRALEVPGIDKQTAYFSSKRAITRWIRQMAPSPEWAGAGIPLNAVAPGLIETPLTRDWREDPKRRAEVLAMVPQPLAAGGVGTPEQVAEVLAWLTSPENSLVTGQVLYVDGGYEALHRGDDVF